MLPLVGLALAVGVPAAIVTIAALVADLTVLGMAVAFVVTASRGAAWWPVVVATSASLTRLTLAGQAASRCLCAHVVRARR